MSTPENIAPEDDANLINRELVYVAALIILGLVFAFLILSGDMFL
jgi:hypothetical protein